MINSKYEIDYEKFFPGQNPSKDIYLIKLNIFANHFECNFINQRIQYP